MDPRSVSPLSNSWTELRATERGNKTYRFKYYVLDPTVRVGSMESSGSIRVDLSFIAEMSILEALRTSRLIPKWAIEEFDREHQSFKKWAEMKGKIDTL